MGVIPNPRYESFAQGLARGKSAAQAYAEAGFPYDRGNASRLQRHTAVLQRVDELITAKDNMFNRAEKKAVERVAVDKVWVLQRLINVAERSHANADSKGETRALELIGKEMGMFINRTEVGSPGDFSNLDSVTQIIEAVRKELGDNAANAIAGLLAKPVTPTTIDQ